MMKKLFLIFLCFIIITGCQRNEVLKTHGISFLDKREKLIFVKKTNKTVNMFIKNEDIRDFYMNRIENYLKN